MLQVLKRFVEVRRVLPVVAAGLLLAAIAYPIWRISLGAPQYPEGPLIVEMFLYPALAGDYEEVNALNSYVGFYYPDPVFVDPDFPVHEKSIQAFEWVAAPVVFAVLALLNLFVAVAPSTDRLKLGLKCLFGGTAVVFATTVVLVQARLYQAGHSLDPDAPLNGVDGFTPPVLGSYEVANIEGAATLGTGGFLTVVAVGCLALAFVLRHNDVTVFGAPGAVFARLKGLFVWLTSLPRGGEGDRSERGYAEAGFLVVVAGTAVALAAAPLVVGAPDDQQASEAFDLDFQRDFEPPSVAPQPVAHLGEESFDTVEQALEAAEPGDTVQLEGRFDERPVVDTPQVTLRAGEGGAVIDGGGEGRVITVDAEDAVLEGLWFRNSGYDVGNEDAGVFVAGDGVELRDLYVSEVTFGVWVDGVEDVTIADSRIEGREDVWPVVDRGNGIHLWEADGAHVTDNEITRVRDGIYYSWADGVVAEDNAIWNSRYGVHYMYSSDNRLVGNVAVDNDVGYALMVSERLEIVDNIAVRNAGHSGHGILVKDIDDSVIRDNTVIENHNGFYVYNAQDNRIERNLVLRNRLGVHTTAGSDGQTFSANSFIDNDDDVLTTARDVERWSGDDGGNYWSNARAIDLTNDGTSEVRHRPAGMVEHLMVETPQAAVFANSPAFDAVRLAESSFPVVEAPGVVDEDPLVRPVHDDWRRYAAGR